MWDDEEEESPDEDGEQEETKKLTPEEVGCLASVSCLCAQILTAFWVERR